MQLVNARAGSQTQTVSDQRPFSSPLCQPTFLLCGLSDILLGMPGGEMLLTWWRPSKQCQCIHIALSFRFGRKLLNLLQIIKPHPSQSFNKHPFILQSYMYNNRAQWCGSMFGKDAETLIPNGMLNTRRVQFLGQKCFSKRIGERKVIKPEHRKQTDGEVSSWLQTNNVSNRKKIMPELGNPFSLWALGSFPSPRRTLLGLRVRVRLWELQ